MKKRSKIIKLLRIFHCFRSCERMRKHVFAGQNTQQSGEGILLPVLNMNVRL